jgi:hypothetical protein
MPIQEAFVRNYAFQSSQSSLSLFLSPGLGFARQLGKPRPQLRTTVAALKRTWWDLSWRNYTTPDLPQIFLSGI